MFFWSRSFLWANSLADFEMTNSEDGNKKNVKANWDKVSSAGVILPHLDKFHLHVCQTSGSCPASKLCLPRGHVGCLVRMVLVFAGCTSLKPVYVLCANACRCVVCTGLHSCRMQMGNHVLHDYLLAGNDCTAFSILCHTPKKRRSYGAIQPFLVSTQFWRPAKCVLTNQNYVLIGHERYRMKYTRDLTFPYLLSEIRC